MTLHKVKILNKAEKEAEKNTVIWRYMNFVSFYSIVISKALYFKRIDKYTDKLEGTIFKKTVEELYKRRLDYPFTKDVEARKAAENEKLNIETYKAWTLSNSWIISEDENYLMWKTYLDGHKEGIAIKTTVSKLNECLGDNKEFEVFTMPVSYEPLKTNQLDVYHVSHNKRQYYKSENEFRATIQFQFNVNRKTGERTPKFDDGTNVKVDLEKLIDEIYISPFAGDWFYELVESLRKEHLPFLNPTKITKSNINDN